MFRFFIFCLTFFGIIYGIHSYLNPKNSNIDFYYWKQVYDVKTSNTIKPNYIKILDIENQKNRIQIHKTSFLTKPNKKIIPVIYIENRAFLDKKLNAKTIFQELQKIALENYFSFDEIQIDCDWDKSTKDRYFEFLKNIKTISKKQICATIRLHQLKYHQTGIPPVNKGILMYYNMSNFKDVNIKNYILDNDIGKKYLTSQIKYPLKLDVALPIYNQVVIMRYNKIVSFVDNPTIDFNNFKPLGDNKFLSIKENFIGSKIVYEGDIIRVDSVTEEDLKEAKDILESAFGEVENIIFFRYDNLDDFKIENLKKIVGNQ